MSETEDSVEEDPNYDASSSDENETLSADPHVASELKATWLVCK